MKYLDRVRVLNDNYVKEGVKKGDEGHILFAWIGDIHREVFVCIADPVTFADDEGHGLFVGDLEVVWVSGITDDDILEEIKSKDSPCKIVDGFIVDLNGKKYNKIAYDYKS
ncbi:MAG: hypothetical protein LBT20_00365 [Clostridiales bacterium]|jgi:hypothetical protein|nr:hypothetical protein [Clostridiales bacterium]